MRIVLVVFALSCKRTKERESRVTACFAFSPSTDKYPDRSAAACDKPLSARSLWQRCSCQAYLNCSIPVVLASVALPYIKALYMRQMQFQVFKWRQAHSYYASRTHKRGAEGWFMPLMPAEEQFGTFRIKSTYSSMTASLT